MVEDLLENLLEEQDDEGIRFRTCKKLQEMANKEYIIPSQDYKSIQFKSEE